MSPVRANERPCGACGTIRSITQRRRAPLSVWLLSGLVVLVAIAGVVAIADHRRDSGRTLIGLSVVLMVLDLVLAGRAARELR